LPIAGRPLRKSVKEALNPQSPRIVPVHRRKTTLGNKPVCRPELWPLNPAITFLNHGSFGSCPHAVLEAQREMRLRLELEPVQFFIRELEPLLARACAELAAFLGAEADCLAMVPNATAGVNTVLRSLRFKRGDEILVTDHEYNATRNAAEFAAQRAGARVVVAPVPFPLSTAGQIEAAILERITPRTRLVLLDHVTSQTGLIFPVEALSRELSARGIDLLVDGAHAPGMIPLNLRNLGAAYYTGNCHKWICGPKGAAFLYVRRDRQQLIRPLSISHGANSPRTDRSRFLIEFGWTGTTDPTPWLAVAEALKFVGGLLPGGWKEVMQRNHALALAARRVLCDALEIDLPCPDRLLGSLASVPLPDAAAGTRLRPPLFLDPLQEKLYSEDKIEVPIVPWPAWPKRLLRVSAQLYNCLPQYRSLAGILRRELRPN
jgi:isopenicillin-N epimerase